MTTDAVEARLRAWLTTPRSETEYANALAYIDRGDAENAEKNRLRALIDQVRTANAVPQLRSPGGALSAPLAVAEPALPEPSEVLKRAVFLDVTFHRWGRERVLKKDEYTVDVNDRRATRAAKTLFYGSPEVAAIEKRIAACEGYIDALLLPGMRKLHALPLRAVAAVRREIDACFGTREERAAQGGRVAGRVGELVMVLVGRFPDLVEKDREILNGRFRDVDYPTDPTELYRVYGVSERPFVSLATPETLREVDPALYEEQKRALADETRGMVADMRAALRAGLAELVDEMAGQLETKPDGKSGKIYDSTSKKLSTFLSNFSDRNLTDDAALAALVAQARGLLSGVAPDDLRKSADLRQTVLAGMTAVAEGLAPLVKDRPFRKITIRPKAMASDAALQEKREKKP